MAANEVSPKKRTMTQDRPYIRKKEDKIVKTSLNEGIRAALADGIDKKDYNSNRSVISSSRNH